jgi:hypothetical protein
MRYHPPAPNYYVRAALRLSGIGPLAMWQNRWLGWTPWVTPLFFGR